MSSAGVDAACGRSLSCGDMYGLLGEEEQNLLKEPVVAGRPNVDASVDASGIPQISRSSRSPAAVSSDLPLIPSQLSIAKPVDGGWGWMVVIGAFFVHVIIDGLASGFGILFVDLYDYFEGSRVKISLSGAFLYSLPMLVAPISSALIDVYGCRVVGFVGGLLSAAGAIAGAFVTSVDTLIIFFGVLVGLGLSLTLTSAFVIIVVFFERRRTLASGLAISGIGVGTTVFPPLLDLMLETYTWRGTFLIMGALFLQAGAFCLLFKPVESGTRRRQRLYLRTLENFSRIVGLGDFLVGEDYLKSGLNKQINMLRAHVSSHSTVQNCSAAHALGNSTVETLAWPSVLDDSTTSSSSSQNSTPVVSNLVSTNVRTQCHSLQETSNEDGQLLDRSYQMEALAPKAEAEEDVDDESSEEGDHGEDPLLQPDALVDCLREIEMYDNMPDPESYRIPLPDPILDVIPENAELDLTTLTLTRTLCSSSSSSSVQVLHSLAYDTYLDLSNPQLDDYDEDDEDVKQIGGLLSYKSLPSARSNSGRLTSLEGSMTSQSLGSLVRIEYGSVTNMPQNSDPDGPLCRTSSDPELLRRRQYRTFDLSSAKPVGVNSDSDVGKIPLSKSPNGNDAASNCWEPLLLPASPVRRGAGRAQDACMGAKNEALGLHHALVARNDRGDLAHSAECVPFSSIGRLSIALSMPRLHTYSEQSLTMSGSRRQRRDEFDLRSTDLIAACSRCCHGAALKSIFSPDSVFCNLPFLCLFLSNFLVFCFYNMTMFYLGLYCTEIGASEKQIALHFATLGISNFVGQVLVGLIGNLRCVDNVMFFSIMQALMGVSTLLGPLLTNSATVFIHTVSFGLAISGGDALSTVLCVHFLGLEKANSGIGINLFGQGVANLIGPPIIGMVIEVTGSYSPAFIASGLGLLLAGVVMLPAVVINQRRRRHHCCFSNTAQRPATSQSVACDQPIASDVELV